ncbi:MAG: MFS transporter [Planctomycetes bacterium]|nr:MFS transporter [Planctomycetota bacterium]
MFWRHKSYEVLPALSIHKRELRKSLRIVTIAWMFGVVWLTCCASGDQIRAFCKAVGFSDWHFGVLGALPFLATFGQLFASLIIENTGLRKYQFLYFATAHRLLWIVVAVVPFTVSVPSETAVVLVLVAIGMSYLTSAFAEPAWITWMADMIPRRIRGRYFAIRARWAQAVQIVVVLVVGVLTEWAVSRGDHAVLSTVGTIFIVAALFGAFDVQLFRRIREVKPSTKHKVRPPVLSIDVPRPAAGANPLSMIVYWIRCFGAGLYQLLLDPLKDKLFRHYVGFGATITFSAVVAGWFFWRQSSEVLGFGSLGAQVLFLVVGPLAGMLASGLWGRLVDRWGRRPVLMIATLCATSCLLPWFFAARGTPAPQFIVDSVNWMSSAVGSALGHPEWQLAGQGKPVGAYLLAMLACCLGGAGWVGVGLAQTGLMLGISDSKGRSRFVAAAAVLINLGGIAGGLVGGKLAQSFEFLRDAPFGPFDWNNYHVTMVAAVVARFMAVFWLVNMPDPGSIQIGLMMKRMAASVFNNVSQVLAYPVQLLNRDRENDKEDDEDKSGD